MIAIVAAGCEPEVFVLEAPPPFVERPAPVSLDDGWDAAPGSGVMFIVNQIAIADKDRGFDVDDRCGEGGCIDNAMWRLGELGNDQIRQAMLGGENLMLIEIAGLDRPYRGDDPEVTFKFYGAKDADEPFFPANNFKVPPGHTTCCDFLIDANSVQGAPPQARNRIRARIERGRLETLQTGQVRLTFTSTTFPGVTVDLARVSGRIPTELDEFNEGLLGGAIPVATLAEVENPYCKTISPRCPQQRPANSSLLDLVAQQITSQPDIDLDGDGAECAIDSDGDGAIDLCCDAEPTGCNAKSRCEGRTISAVEPASPFSCARSPMLADGYSVGITFTAVGAKAIGVGHS